MAFAKHCTYRKGSEFAVFWAFNIQHASALGLALTCQLNIYDTYLTESGGFGMQMHEVMLTISYDHEG